MGQPECRRGSVRPVRGPFRGLAGLGSGAADRDLVRDHGRFRGCDLLLALPGPHLGNYANGILLASAAGALGVKLGDPLRQDYSVKYRPELGLGDEADPSFLKSAVGLVWRSALLWLAVTLLISVASHMG
ncbi:CobD/CbiB family protein [Chromobacterium violaceum]|uniref:CobD/CbiB family protein n=1 Tax=Chromobacterium violaceum TaxID=536 RepID=A0A3S4LHL3_CHRVL|nr:CobD/CbiB family protein [Chromobacterium violaceum]